MSEVFVIQINFFLYLFLSIFLAKMKGGYSLVAIVSYFYSLGAFFSLLLYFNPLYITTYSASGTATIEACLYSFIVNFLLITSFYTTEIDNVKKITRYNEVFLFKLEKFLCVLFVIYLMFSLPSSISKFFSGANLADFRNELYGNNSSNSFFLISLISRFFGSMPIVLLGIVLIRIILLKKRSIWDSFSLAVYVLIKINTVLAAVTRQTIIFSALEVVIALFVFRKHLSKTIKKKILKYALIIVPFMYSTFSLISYARFGVNGVENENLATLRYAGEANLNFMNLMYGNVSTPFMGYSQFPLFRRILGLSYDDGTTRDGATVFNTYIQSHYHYYNPTYIFHGLVGNFYSNYGSIGCIILSLLINIAMRHTFRNKKQVSCISIIVSIIMGAYIAKGIFYGDYGFESGNFLLFYLFVMGYILKTTGYSLKIK